MRLYDAFLILISYIKHIKIKTKTMALKKLNLTEEHIKLIQNMVVTKDSDFGTIGVDFENPYSESENKYDDIAMILGDYEKRRVDGNRITYHEDLITKYDELESYIVKNFEDIVDFMFYNFGKTIEPGSYQTKTTCRLWVKK